MEVDGKVNDAMEYESSMSEVSSIDFNFTNNIKICIKPLEDINYVTIKHKYFCINFYKIECTTATLMKNLYDLSFHITKFIDEIKCIVEQITNVVDKKNRGVVQTKNKEPIYRVEEMKTESKSITVYLDKPENASAINTLEMKFLLSHINTIITFPLKIIKKTDWLTDFINDIKCKKLTTLLTEITENLNSTLITT